MTCIASGATRFSKGSGMDDNMLEYNERLDERRLIEGILE